jgi:hypothetical protein
MNLQKDTGNLVKTLEGSDDPNLKYLLHVRELKNGKAKQLDRGLFEPILSRVLDNRTDEGIRLSDIVEHMDLVDDNGPIEIGGQFVDAIREYATRRGLSLAVNTENLREMSVGFYKQDGAVAYGTLRQNEFDSLARIATNWIKTNLKQNYGEFTVPITLSMDFWSPRSTPNAQNADPSKAGTFLLSNVSAMTFFAYNDQRIAGSSLDSRAHITFERIRGSIIVLLKWDDKLGEAKSVPIKSILNLEPEFLRRSGIWRPMAGDGSWGRPFD